MRTPSHPEPGNLVARDLREDLGARLLSQLHQTQDETVARNARTLLGELRELMDTLDPRSYTLAESLDQWRLAFLERAEVAGIETHIQLPAQPPSLTLNPLQRTHPRRILTEFVDNALRHARPTRLWLQVRVKDRLELCCGHNGRSSLPPQWPSARGLRNQRLRAQDLGAKLEWQTYEPDIIEMHLRFNLGDA